MLPKLSLVLGGAASGKSALAEDLVLNTQLNPVYVATAQVFDDEMAQKVARHRDQRGTLWDTIEEPINVASVLERVTEDDAVLIDCATLWLTNLILGEHNLAKESAALLSALDTCAGPIVIVSNETGQGIVPDNALARRFRNAQGTLNQQIAAKADLVVAVMAGLPMTLKGQLP
ncbi:adenosylcobinamide kinase/adenosylcobinamide-phosphate guanylyltransferase [Yoonia maritima]|uniref:Bifunctional adenosylcobalamin biosynthesis protein n=1 Tax=Yoonia maritima TaxID=1435347 RepID=A0A2T0W336_9RHOB|nr:bifunctional adenosylcobinamide kinase/adenosylcobinamide-phosphate guanylyltransferase [Yoonia maritima]PRY79427.1 adenosylcobinamide kinase/adenosylcobinamide-phosphate guanylyltransferase [Yoonia maritima]